MKGLLTVAVMSMVLCSGCATIFSGSRQNVQISSSPSGALAAVYDKNNMKVFEARTPASTSLPKGSGYFSPGTYRIEVTKEGYEPGKAYISSGLNGLYILNIFTGFIGFLIVDPLTGAMWTLEPAMINVDLRPLDNAQLNVPTGTMDGQLSYAGYMRN